MDLPAIFCRDLRVCRMPLIACVIFEVSAAADQHILVISRYIGDYVSGPPRLQNNLQRGLRTGGRVGREINHLWSAKFV
jgi:hypothetical protein